MLDLSASNSNKEQLLSCLLDSLPARIVLRDLTGRSTYVNQHARNWEQQKHEGGEKKTSLHNKEEEELPRHVQRSGQQSEEDEPTYDSSDSEESSGRSYHDNSDTTEKKSNRMSSPPSSSRALKKSLSFPVQDPHGHVIGTCTCEFLEEEDEETAATTATTTTTANSSITSSTTSPPSSAPHTPTSTTTVVSTGASGGEEPAPVLPEQSSSTEAAAPAVNQMVSHTPSTGEEEEQKEEHKQENKEEVQVQNIHQQLKEQTKKLEIYDEIMEKIETAISLNEVVVNDQGEPIDYIFLYVNPAFENFLGISAADCVGQRVTNVIPGIEQDCVNWIQKFGNVGVHGVTEQFTQYSERLQNWYTGLAYPTDRDRHGFAVLFHESSDHIASQQALQESEERHRNLFESMMQGVVYQDATGNIIAANPAAERILGLTVDQMMGRTSVDPRWKASKQDGSDFPGPEHPSMVALKTGKPCTNVTMGVFSPKSNETRWIKVDAVPRFKSSRSNSNGEGGDENANQEEEPQKPWQVHATFTDITETKRFEHKLLRAKEKAQQSDKLKSAFLANMSHEIRTPLNGIMGHIDLALSNGLSEPWRQENLEGLRIAKGSGSLLLSIIQDILDLSKIEAGQMVINLDESFSMKSTVDQTSSLAMALIKSKNKGIAFTCQMEERINDVVFGDPFRLQQVRRMRWMDGWTSVATLDYTGIDVSNLPFFYTHVHKTYRLSTTWSRMPSNSRQKER